MARLENVTYEEIVSHLECVLELNGSEAGDDTPVSSILIALATSRPGSGDISSGIATNQVTLKMTVGKSSERKTLNSMTGCLLKRKPQTLNL